MTDFKEMLGRDTDESVDWARRLSAEQSEPAAQHFFGVLADKEQSLMRRINAAFILNALASSRSLSESIGTQALGLLPGLLHEEDRDVRRNGLVAFSSVLHSVAPNLPVARRDLLRQLLDGCALTVPDEWERGVLSSTASVLANPGAKGGQAPAV